MKAALQDPSLAPPPPVPPHLGKGVKGSHPEAGFLSVQGQVTAGGRSGKFDDVLGYGWTVLARPGTLDQLSAAARQWAQDYGIRLFEIGERGSVSDDAGTYTAWFDELGADAVIIRPDFYVYDAGTAAHVSDALEELQATLTPGVMVG
jgi:hypothetical protein